MPMQSIICNEGSIMYTSEKIVLKKKYTFREKLKQMFIGHRKLDCVVENLHEAIGYIGLTQNKGHIIVVEPFDLGSILI